MVLPSSAVAVVSGPVVKENPPSRVYSVSPEPSSWVLRMKKPCPLMDTSRELELDTTVPCWSMRLISFGVTPPRSD